MDGCGVHVEPPVGRAAPPRRTPARDAVRRGARTSGRGEWTLCRVVKSGVRRNKTKRRIERRQTPGRRSASEQARRSPYPTYQDEMNLQCMAERETGRERKREHGARHGMVAQAAHTHGGGHGAGKGVAGARAGANGGAGGAVTPNTKAFTVSIFCSSVASLCRSVATSTESAIAVLAL